MKLYEFTFTDNMNLSESEVLARVQNIVESEAQVQGWQPGYVFTQCQKSRHLSSGELQYFFEVNDAAADLNSADQDSHTSSDKPDSSGVAARSPDL